METELKSIRPGRKYMSRIDHLVHNLPSRCGYVLDVGNIGEGESSHIRLQKVVQERGGIAVGCDLKLLRAMELRYPMQTIGDILYLPYQNDTFDACYLGEILEHLWSPFEALREISRVMRLHGTLIISVPHVFSLSKIIRWVLLGKDSIGNYDHKTFFTPASMNNMLLAAGFTVESVTTARKIRLGPLHLNWIPFGDRLGSYLLVLAKKI